MYTCCLSPKTLIHPRLGRVLRLSSAPSPQMSPLLCAPNSSPTSSSELGLSPSTPLFSLSPQLIAACHFLLKTVTLPAVSSYASFPSRSEPPRHRVAGFSPSPPAEPSALIVRRALLRQERLGFCYQAPNALLVDRASSSIHQHKFIASCLLMGSGLVQSVLSPGISSARCSCHPSPVWLNPKAGQRKIGISVPRDRGGTLEVASPTSEFFYFSVVAKIEQ